MSVFDVHSAVASQGRPNSPGFSHEDFPRFIFKTDPYMCLNLVELHDLHQRLGQREFYSHFEQKEAEYRFSGSHFMNARCKTKMRSAQKQLVHLQMRYEKLFSQEAKGQIEQEEEKAMFFDSNLIRLIMTIDGNEDSIGHSHLVTRYALLLTKALGLRDGTFVLHMERGAALHDIGKIGVPDQILRKKGALNPAERRTIQEHPFLGYELIEEFDFLKKAARIVLFHHEKYDGSGYPYGLKEKEIPLEARIFAVVDAFDAITSDRHYSQGQSFSAAVREIKRCRGTHFDPDVVDAFLSVHLDSWLRLKMDARLLVQSQTAH